MSTISSSSSSTRSSVSQKNSPSHKQPQESASIGSAPEKEAKSPEKEPSSPEKESKSLDAKSLEKVAKTPQEDNSLSTSGSSSGSNDDSENDSDGDNEAFPSKTAQRIKSPTPRFRAPTDDEQIEPQHSKTPKRSMQGDQKGNTSQTQERRACQKRKRMSSGNASEEPKRKKEE